MSEVIFEAGDVVTCAFFGDREFVLEETSKNYGYDEKYPVTVRFLGEDGVSRDEVFTREGFSHVNHTAPVLKLVRKKTKKRTVIELFKIDSENESFFLKNNEFGSYEDAFDWIKRNGINGWVYSINKLYKIKDL